MKKIKKQKVKRNNSPQEIPELFKDSFLVPDKKAG